MATPRSQLVDSEQSLFYHLISRCVRRAMLCGDDPYTGKNYDHRKGWIEDRLLDLAKHFSVDLYAHSIMDNHLHLVVYFDPMAAKRWSNEEVARRWVAAFPPKSRRSTQDLEALKELKFQATLEDARQLKKARKTLGSLSRFMKHLKQPIAYRANREDGCTGHFFEGRFYSGALLDEAHVLTAMAYVDLNPVRAKIVDQISDTDYTSAAKRLANFINDPTRVDEYLAPLVSGLKSDESEESDQSKPPRPPLVSITARSYLQLLQNLAKPASLSVDDEKRWIERLASIGKQRRAYGTTAQLTTWAAQRGWSR